MNNKREFYKCKLNIIKKAFDEVENEFNEVNNKIRHKMAIDNASSIIDFKKSNLHVVSYSVPIDKKVSLEELKAHLHTNQEQPDLIPYVTSYYKEDWGFCMPYNQFKNLQKGEYRVFIDSSFKHILLSV